MSRATTPAGRIIRSVTSARVMAGCPGCQRAEVNSRTAARRQSMRAARRHPLSPEFQVKVGEEPELSWPSPGGIPVMVRGTAFEI